MSMIVSMSMIASMSMTASVASILSMSFAVVGVAILSMIFTMGLILSMILRGMRFFFVVGRDRTAGIEANVCDNRKRH